MEREGRKRCNWSEGGRRWIPKSEIQVKNQKRKMGFGKDSFVHARDEERSVRGRDGQIGTEKEKR